MRLRRSQIALIAWAFAMTALLDNTVSYGQSEPTGASAAFTSTDPLIVNARKLMEQGQFAQAEKLLDSAGAGSQPAASELREIIARIRIAYSLDAAAMLAKLQPSIPGVARDDLDKWRRNGEVQFRMIDGQVCYFEREPGNIFRFCGEAKQRRQAVPSQAPQWKLEDHLARVIAEAQRTGSSEVVPMRHRVRYVLTIAANAPHLKMGSNVRVWLPFPQEYLRQGDVKLISTLPAYKVIAPSASGEPPTDGAPQRTVYFEQTVVDPSKQMAFEETFEFTSSAYYPSLEDSKARPLSAKWGGAYLAERAPHIRFSPELRETVAKVVGNETNPLAKARKIFHYINQNISYCAEEEYSTIPSVSEKAFTSRRGDCGVQSMLFITMCRIAGVPARWQSGWETKRVDLNMHDWAEFYVEPWGWLPADPSYGLRQSDDPRVREFYFGHQDSYRMIVNRDYGAALSPPKSSLRSEPLDFQRGEVEVDGFNLYFPYWDYDLTIGYLTDGL
jgi:transglutaminase-like putative cysteine protease